MHKPGRFLASREPRACRQRALEVWHWHGHAIPCCAYRSRSSGGNGLFSMCIIQSLTTDVQCDWLREEPPVSLPPSVPSLPSLPPLSHAKCLAQPRL